MRQFVILILVVIAFCGSLYVVWRNAEFNQPKMLVSESEAMPPEFKALAPDIPYHIEGKTPPFLQNLQGRNVHLVIERYLNLSPEQAGRIRWKIPADYTGLIRYDWLKPGETDVYTFQFEGGVFLRWKFQFRFDPEA